MEPTYSRAIAEAPVILFAGAGASAHLCQPTMDQLYEELDAQLARDEDTARVWHELSAGPPPRNVEHILEMAEASCNLRRALGEERQVAAIVESGRAFRFTTWDAARRISSAIKAHIVRRYGPLATARELAECYVPLLSAVLDLRGYPVLPLFTTNYDLVLESFQAHPQLLDVRWEGGFNQPKTPLEQWRWDRARLDRVACEAGPPRVVIFKLHGSISWERYQEDIVVRYDLEQRPRLATEDKALIWPALTKVAREEPFRTGYEYLGRCLDNARLAVFVGYGFQDVGVMERVRAAVRHNRGLQIVVVDPEPKAEAFKQWGLEWSQVDHIALPLAPDSVAEVCDTLETWAPAPGALPDAVPASVLGWEKTGSDWGLEIVDAQTVRLGGTSAGWKELVSPDTYTNFRFSAEVLQEGDDDWAALFFRRRGEADCWALMAQTGAVKPKRIQGPGPEDQDEWEPVWASEASLADRWVELSIEVRGEEARLKARSSGGGWREEKSVRDAEGLQGPIALACRQGDHAAQFRNIGIERL